MPSSRSIMSNARLAPNRPNPCRVALFLRQTFGIRPSRCGSGGFLLTLTGVVEGGDRDLEHVVGRLASGELLGPEHGQKQHFDDWIGAMPRHEADALKPRPGDDRERKHSAGDEPEPGRVKDRDDA